MRGLPSVLGGIVATLAAIVTVPILWVAVNVQDEDGFATLSGRLATDAELQGSLAQYLADDFVQRGLLPAALQETAAAAMTTVARQTTNQPGFGEAWEQTQRELHRSAFDGSTGPVVMDLGPIADFVAERVGEQLPASLQVPDTLTVPIADEGDRTGLRWVDRSRTLSMLGLIVVLVGLAMCVLGARRRPFALVGVGAGALVTAGVLRVATSIVAPRLVDAAETSSPFARSFTTLLVDRAADSLRDWLEPIAVAGAGAVVLGLVGQAFVSWSRRRSDP